METKQGEIIRFFVILALMLGMASPLCQKISGEYNLLELCRIDRVETVSLAQSDEAPTQPADHIEMPCVYCLMSSNTLIQPQANTIVLNLDIDIESVFYAEEAEILDDKIFVYSRGQRAPPVIS